MGPGATVQGESARAALRDPILVPAVLLIWGATWLNLSGTRAVGLASGWFAALVLSPFAGIGSEGRAGRWNIWPSSFGCSLVT